MDKATVFQIERCGTEDGPGIRTVIFLKGCALRCKWCANPESQLFEKQVMFNGEVCVNCERCIKLCPRQCIEKIDGYGFITTGRDCTQCGICVDNCYVNSRSIIGIDYTVDEIIEEVLKDEPYYKESGGGVTFTGGEPLFYSDFIKECSLKLNSYGIPVLVETCGHIPLENLISCSDYIDSIFFDVKHMDTKQHKLLTGMGNELILNNLEWLNDHFKGSLSVRYPFIPGCNDEKGEIESFLSYISKLNHVSEVWFLPYHRLGIPKYRGLGRVYEMSDMESLKFKDLSFLKNYEKEYNVSIKI